MPLPTPPDEDQLRQAKLRAQRLANAFQSVFGQPKTRSDEQKLVLSHLATCAGEDQNSYRFDQSKDGISLIAAGLHRDGAKSVLRIIERQLQIASNSTPSKAAKPKTQR